MYSVEQLIKEAVQKWKEAGLTDERALRIIEKEMFYQRKYFLKEDVSIMTDEEIRRWRGVGKLTLSSIRAVAPHKRIYLPEKRQPLKDTLIDCRDTLNRIIKALDI